MAQRKGLLCPLTMDQIDAFFSLRDVPKGDTAPGLTFNGRPYDPIKKQPYEVEEEYQVKSRFKQSKNLEDPVGIGPMSVTTFGIEDSTLIESSIAPGDMHQLETETLPELTYLDINNAGNRQDPNMLEVYQHYNFNHVYDDTLSVHRQRAEIVNTIESNEVTIIQGSTGCGKTTQIPQFILDDYKRRMKYCNIVVTQPRKIAATSIARRVCHERNWQLGQLVGYQVGLDRCTSEDTRITYMTVGVLLKQLIKEKCLKRYTHIILDEVHERDQETDFALLVVRKFLRWNSQSVKVILMSATIETDIFAEYFSTIANSMPVPAPVVSVDGRSYRVKEHFIEELEFLGSVPMPVENDPDITDEAFFVAAELIGHFDKLESEEFIAGGAAAVSNRKGAVLVFLPGLFHIRELEQLLERSLGNSKLMIVPLHSSITLEEQCQVFAIPKDGIRKVILATNIAESSITVPDIKYVIDFCLTKSLVCDLDTNYQSLRLLWASKANGTQRKGRAGRVSDGHVYRMIPKHFWDQYIQPHGIPEMARCPLEHVILQVKLLDLGEPKTVLAAALSPPEIQGIERTVLLLKEVGALSTIGHIARQRHDGDLTFVGRVLASLPLDMKLGKMLLLGYVFGCLEDCIVIAAALSKGSFLATPYRETLKAYKFRLLWAKGSFSDSIALKNAYRAWEKAINTQMFRKRRDEYLWCKNNFIQPRRIREVHMLVQELTDRLRSFNIRSTDQFYWENDTAENSELILKVVMAGAFYPNYFSTGETDEADAMKEIRYLDPWNTVMLNGLPPGRAPLYSQSIQNALRDCGKQKSLLFDGSRAFLQFCEETDERLHAGKVNPSVYVACRMKEVRRKLQIVQSHSETKQSSSMLQRPFLIDVIEPNNFQREIPKPGGPVWLPINVTHVVAVDHFWGCKASPSHLEMQHRLFNDIQEDVKTATSITESVNSGTLVLAPYRDKSGIWFCRAIVQSCDNNKAKLFFVDYGNQASNISLSKLKKISDRLAIVPFQAVEFELCNVRPLCNVDSSSAKKELEKILMSCEHRCNVKIFSVVCNRVRVNLFTLSDALVNHILVEKGCVEKCDEGVLSLKNHHNWEDPLQSHMTEVMTENTFTSDWHLIPVEARGPLIPHSRRKLPIQLFGPSNPLQTGVRSMINIGMIRNVTVDRDSVNSVIINQDPNDSCQRLMIASSVGVNDSGATMIARNTTLLPKIHGLPYIVAMLFTPVLELRTNKLHTRLTGALCGLGFMKTRSGVFSILPEHDMELGFDVEFTNEDLVQINALRMKINMCVGTKEEVASWSQSAIHSIQESARKKLLEILTKPRRPVLPDSVPRPYKWDQIEARLINPHNIEHHCADKKDLYRLHDGILLTQPILVQI